MKTADKVKDKVKDKVRRPSRPSRPLREGKAFSRERTHTKGAKDAKGERLQEEEAAHGPGGAERVRRGGRPRPRGRGGEAPERGSPTRSTSGGQSTVENFGGADAFGAVAAQRAALRRQGAASPGHGAPGEELQVAMLGEALGGHRDKTKAAWDSVLKLLADTTVAHANAALAIEGFRRELEAVNNRMRELSGGMAAAAQMRVMPGTG
ncbi:MAG: hypothetical protein C5B50_07770 [Verrucomicrobia bacterium]|nr:MAG: hypothetical protein C5B50_07770 [Verrucomicrobiota bacterium]